MSRLYNKFEFIGELGIPSQEQFHKVNNNGQGWESHRLSFAVKESKTNSVFVEFFGGYKTNQKGLVYSFSKQIGGSSGRKLEIPWLQRLEPSVVDMVADFTKIIVDFETDSEKKKEYNKLRFQIRNLEARENLNDQDKEKLSKYRSKYKEETVNRHEFIHVYDAIQFLSSELSKYDNYKFRITGNLEINEWNGKYYRKYIPSIIEIVPSDARSKLRVTADIFFDKNSLDEAGFKKDKKLYINGYLKSRDNNAKSDRFFPQQFIIDAAKFDFDNLTQVALFDLFKNNFKVKGKTFHHLQHEVAVYRGAEKIDFTFEQLTDAQKTMVECGLAELEDYAPKDGLLGENIDQLKIIKPILKKINDDNDFTEGAVDTHLNKSEFEKLIVQSTENIQYETIKTQPQKEEIKVDLDSLFADDDLDVPF